MIVSEHYGNLPDGRELIRTYSDEHFYIQKIRTPEIYEEAIDVAPIPQYIETNIDIEKEGNDSEHDEQQ